MLVTSDTAMFPSALDTTAREASKVSVSMVEAAPVTELLDACHDPAPSPSEVQTWPLVPAEGIKYSNSDYHTPIDSEGEDWVYVSRLRKDIYKNNIFNLWVVADNLLKGAALNSVQIGESLIKKKIMSTNE